MIEIRQIQKKDFNSARRFALEGMQFNQYTSNRMELYFYSKYFWYLELSRATTALGAYEDDRLMGVLLAEMNGQPAIFKSLWHKIFIKFVDFIMKHVYKNAADPYEHTNQELLAAFTEQSRADGELICFAADPERKGNGIGTLLLGEFERQEENKLIYLFTDSQCTYQFYIHRNFIQSGQKEITLTINKKTIPLTCFLFSKKLGLR